MSEDKHKTKEIHYVIVVHGIGRQRKNETVLPVIKQFAAARHGNTEPSGFLTLGRLTAQTTEKQWIEFQGIPNVPDDTLIDQPWFPRLSSDQQGKNIRFVDFCWSDVTYEHHKQVGETTEVWSQSLIERLRLRVKREQAKSENVSKPSQWILDMIETLQEGVLFTEKIMSLRLPKLSNEVFGDFLGDVEMYGDYPYTRGRAVRLFHETMAKVHAAHCLEFPDDQVTPHYSIIAHSLGTVLSMDAIAFAYANKQSRLCHSQANSSDDVVHLPGYDCSLLPGESCHPVYKDGQLPEHLPDVAWAQYLQSYVSLGSPIDKYLSLWSENYFHFDNTKWMDHKQLQQRENKIRHFNYSDEQDPVGHELNILRQTPVWEALVEVAEDIVFTRYPVPGVAHVGYWDDYGLFCRILDISIDKRQQPLEKNKQQVRGHYVEWFDARIYWLALLISYVAIPSAGWLIATVSLDSIVQEIIQAKNAGGIFHTPWVAAIIFVLTLTLTHILMKLIIKWHLVLVESRKEKSPMKAKKERQRAQAVILAIIKWTPVLWGGLFLAIVIPDISNSILPAFMVPCLPTLLVGLFLAFMVSFDIQRVCVASLKKWNKLKGTMLTTKLSDYLQALR